MRYVNRAAGGAAILLLLTLVLVSCNTALFGRVAQAETAWAHVVSGFSIADKADKQGRYRVRVMYCCITVAGPMDCDQIMRGISVPKYAVDTYAGSPAAIPVAWHWANLTATQSCRRPT